MTGFDGTPKHGWLVHRLLETRAGAAPNFPFLHFEDRDYTHAEMNSRANRMAAGLIALDMRKGTRVAVMMKSAPEYIDVWFAIAKAGAVEVPLNTAEQFRRGDDGTRRRILTRSSCGGSALSSA